MPGFPIASFERGKTSEVSEQWDPLLLSELGYDLNKSFLSELCIYEVILLFDLLHFIELSGSDVLSFFIEV